MEKILKSWLLENNKNSSSFTIDDLISFANYYKDNSIEDLTLTIPDIRNKLSPITHLISMVERDEIEYAKKALTQSKLSVNYLAKREVYKNK